jgi:hypothetical protein
LDDKRQINGHVLCEEGRVSQRLINVFAVEIRVVLDSRVSLASVRL